MGTRRTRMKGPVTAYLIDKQGRVHSTHLLYEPDPEDGVQRMNRTAAAATDGRLRWTLSQDEVRTDLPERADGRTEHPVSVARSYRTSDPAMQEKNNRDLGK